MLKFHFLLDNSTEKSYFRKYANKMGKIIFLAKKLYFDNNFIKGFYKRIKQFKKDMGDTSTPPSY